MEMTETIENEFLLFPQKHLDEGRGKLELVKKGQSRRGKEGN
jgi:hypothetical protein